MSGASGAVDIEARPVPPFKTLLEKSEAPSGDGPHFCKVRTRATEAEATGASSLLARVGSVRKRRTTDGTGPATSLKPRDHKPG